MAVPFLYYSGLPQVTEACPALAPDPNVIGTNIGALLIVLILIAFLALVVDMEQDNGGSPRGPLRRRK